MHWSYYPIQAYLVVIIKNMRKMIKNSIFVYRLVTFNFKCIIESMIATITI